MQEAHSLHEKMSRYRSTVLRGIALSSAIACSQLAWADIGNMTRLYSFSMTDGNTPQSPLVQGKDGNFYGTTNYGGSSNLGTLFQLTPSGGLTVLHNFTGPDGAIPSPGLMLGMDGTLYGANSGDGSATDGSINIFSIAPNGAYNVLYTFAPTLGSPNGIIQGTDGNFYGTTGGGGDFGYGAIFKVTPGGTLTVLHSFNQADGAEPVAPLVQASDGNFYGTTSYGGSPSGLGTLFKMTPDGTLTVLHAFTSFADGVHPNSALLVASDGNLYGTTSDGGTSSGYGTLFRISLQGDFTVIHFFNHTEGDFPCGQLVQGLDGALYGSTEYGGVNARGNIYKMTLSGTVTSIYSFTGGADGAYPQSGLTLGSDGAFYGSTTEGGDQYDGVLFKLTDSPGTPTPYIEAGSGLYQYGYDVRLSDDDPQATLYYTTDGSTPTHSSSVSTGLITLKHSMVLKVMASDNGYDSAIATAGYLVQTSEPAYNLQRIKGGYIVSLEDQTPLAAIHYTTDGSVPTDSSPIYRKPFLVTQTTTLQALATRAGLPDSPMLVAQIAVKHRP